MDATPTSTPATVILDMNDKCLVEVFKHLKLIDLCAVAEVCRRFKQNATACFELSEKTDLILMEDVKCEGDSNDQVIFRISKILHHFGAYFTKFDGADWDSNGVRHWIEKPQRKCQRRMFELLIQYCSGTLVELTFFGINIEDGMVPSMKPLLEGLQILDMHVITVGQAFLDMLPLLSTTLRVFKLDLNGSRKDKVLRFDTLHQPLRKMVEIGLCFVGNLNNHDVEEILRHNPQLRRITLNHCSKLDLQIFESIANHVPDIESLDIDLKFDDQRHIPLFAEFRNLKSLKYRHRRLKSEYVVSLVRQIAEANIPLEILDLCNFQFRGKRKNALQFVEVVSKLKSLHTLKLKCLPGLSEAHFYITCKNLPQLRQASLHPIHPLSITLITDIIRNADQLEWIHFSSRQRSCEKRLTVDSRNFKEWVKIVNDRCNDTPLEIWLCAESYATKHTIPLKASEGAFTLLISGGIQNRGDIDYELLARKLHSRCRSVDNF